VNHHAARRELRAVGVVLPVHDEEELLPGALQALETAINSVSPRISCRVAIVLDRCGDASWAIAQSWGARFGALVIRRECRSVGMARQSGGQALLARWPKRDRADIWLATTDADSRVPQDWLTVQMAAHSSGVDLWAGRVNVVEQSAAMRRWTERYATEPNPIHGASLGFSALLFTQLGGFRNLCSGEDHDFHDRAVAGGFRVAYDSRATVATSSRRMGRAPEGFASVLETVEQEELEATA
jgi:cellulose synthase/poly-beta-1,6-N-acetylglucosamine synthase-like glycosyltransferase